MLIAKCPSCNCQIEFVFMLEVDADAAGSSLVPGQSPELGQSASNPNPLGP